MKNQEIKAEFIRLRAVGRKAIAEDIGVSKSSISDREKELRAKADRLRKGNLEELHSYLRDMSIV